MFKLFGSKLNNKSGKGNLYHGLPLSHAFSL